MPILDGNDKGEGRQPPIENTRGLWLYKNRAEDSLELWFDGKFQCAWDEADIIEPRIDALLDRAMAIGVRKAQANIRAALGIQ